MDNIKNALAWADHKKAAIVPAHTLAAEVRRLRAELAEARADYREQYGAASEANGALTALKATPCPECARKDEAIEIARELHQMFSFPAHPGYPARKAGFLRESEWIEMGTKLAALSTGAGEKI